MSKLALLIAAGVLGGATFFGALASFRGWGLAGGLAKPVSIRQHSNHDSRRHRRSGLAVFGSQHRRHSRGGFLGGK